MEMDKEPTRKQWTNRAFEGQQTLLR
jgi:hypothetical protein